MALRHERFERALDTVGIGERLRPEDGRRGRMGMMGPDLSSYEEGVVGSADDRSVVIKLNSGKEVSFSRSDQVQIMPRHIKLSSGMRVEVDLDDDTVRAVRILPRD